MSMDRDQILQQVLGAIDDLNAQLPSEQQLTITPDTVLFGQAGKLDSLGLVNLIVGIEDQLAAAFGVNLTLADEKAMSLHRSPFRTVATLVDYIAQRLEETAGE